MRNNGSGPRDCERAGFDPDRFPGLVHPEAPLPCERDRAGAYFIDRPLMEKYEALRRRVAELRADIVGARIDADRARAEVTRLQSELAEIR